MRRQPRKPMSGTKRAKTVREIAQLEDIPNVGRSIAGDLRLLGIALPADLVGRDPFAMYYDLCRMTGQHQDPCVIDVFMAAVRYMEGAPKKPWWKYTAERKRALTALQDGNERPPVG
jgi:hypothetical protein